MGEIFVRFNLKNFQLLAVRKKTRPARPRSNHVNVDPRCHGSGVAEISLRVSECVWMFIGAAPSWYKFAYEIVSFIANF